MTLATLLQSAVTFLLLPPPLCRAMGLNSLVTATQSAAEDCLTDEDRQHLMDTAHKLSIAAVHVLSTVQEIQDKDKMYGRGGAGLGMEWDLCVCVCACSVV